LKWRRNFLAAAAVAAAVAARGELADYIQRLELADRLQGVFFHSATLPGGAVLVRRPPAEARQALSLMITASPNEARLYELRAREAELLLDFTAAEADWKKHAGLVQDRAAGQIALADFYHRRLRPAEEIEALRAAQSFERALAVAAAHALPAQTTVSLYRAWIAADPKQQAVYRRFLDYLTAQRDWPAAEHHLADYPIAFPTDDLYPVRARAAIERQRGSLEKAIAVYDQAFRPLWPAELAKEHITLLREARALRGYFDRVRAEAAARPLDLTPAARLFYFHQQQADLAAAGRALADFRRRKEARKAAFAPEELLALGRLSEAAHDYDEAARCYHALYSLPASQEEALASLANLLLSAPEQPIRFGAGDLSFYRDIATADRGPGFLNGILSLILNSTYPESQYDAQSGNAVAYFHRARGAELAALLDARFPQSARRAGLQSRLIQAYAAYGENDAVIAAGRRFLAGFPESAERVTVALATADAHARKRQEKEEFAVYESLLGELGKKAAGVPLGGKEARSPDYARVLDRYIARLVALKRVRDALALYRRQLDGNPGDAGLYERLAAFLEQNKLAAEVEQVYRRAMAQFADRSWHHKLARWYLRRKQAAQFEALTRDVAKVFAGSELEAYFRDVVEPASLDAVLYRQVNLYAHERFPHDLVFVRNLLSAYARRGTADPAAWEKLLRGHWAHDETLRARFFEFLSRTNRLQPELQAARALPQTPVVARFVAEAEIWLCQFESAEPRLRARAEACPGCRDVAERAASLERSLGNFEAASAIEQKLSQFDPRDTATLTRLGEIRADRDDFARARPWWNRIPEIEPGAPEGYLESATVFWDYFLYDDALAQIQAGRKRLARPSLHAYEAGAIYENKREYARAIEEYARGAAAGGEESSRERERLIALARRPAHRAAIEGLTAKLASPPNPDPGAMALRVALLEAQGRRADLEKYLDSLAATAPTVELTGRVREVAERQGFTRVQERTLAREVALATENADRIRARLALIRLQESTGDTRAARQGIEALYRDHPQVRGVVRAAVDYHWRNKEQARAVEILEQAARSAYPELARQFTLEAAAKATEAGDYRKARALLTPLLAQEPLRPDYVAAMAEVYARQGDDAGLRDFYAGRIQAMKNPEQIAVLRRNLIPVLTRMKDISAALEQYIELMNRYPEDEDLAREAASYATAHNGREPLRQRYTRAAAESPRDARWPLILARLETQFENLPAAIAACDKAIALRPERTDLLQERAEMEERLMRFDAAARTYARLYELTYRNSHWMMKSAEMRAREGKKAEAVAAVRQALIGNRPPRAQAFLEAAGALDGWGMAAEAREFAEKGVELSTPEELSGASSYARVMARLRQYQAAFDKLGTNADGPLTELAQVVRTAYSPEEKAGFAKFLESRKTPERTDFFITLAQAAYLLDLEARWRHEQLLAEPGDSNAEMRLSALISLQRRRARFDELGTQLEAYWKVYPRNEDRDLILERAAEAYRLVGNTQGEIRVLARSSALSPRARQRYFTLLKANQPQQLVLRAARDEEAANSAVAAGDAALALRAIQSRGKGRAPVWTRAYSSLVELHYARATPEARANFAALLGGGTVGERLGRPVDRREQLAGEIWFYYGSRYGEFLAAAGDTGAEDYLPAALEAAPGRAQAYFDLAEFYRERGDRDRALADYERAIELDRKRADAQNAVAGLLAASGRADDAVARWRLAVAALAAQQDERRPPPGFWRDTSAVIASSGKAGAFPALKGDIDRLLRTYVRRNGAYAADDLLSAAAPVAGIEWVLDLANDAADPVVFLESIAEARWLTGAQRDALLPRLIATAAARAARGVGETRESAQNAHRRWKGQWIERLISTGRLDQARQELAGFPAEERKNQSWMIAPLEIRLAARTGGLDALFERYRREGPPSSDQIRNAAHILRRENQTAAAARLEEFIKTREIDEGERSTAAFLGLAEALLEQGQAERAVAALRRMVVVAEQPFTGVADAGPLLARFNRKVEAAEFLQMAVKATPWDEAAKARLAGFTSGPPRPEAPSAEALAADPDRPGLRAALFRAALEAGRIHQAVGAMEAHWDSVGLKHLLYREPSLAEENEDTESSYSYHAGQFLADTDLAAPARAALARHFAWRRSTRSWTIPAARRWCATGSRWRSRRRPRRARRWSGCAQAGNARRRTSGGGRWCAICSTSRCRSARAWSRKEGGRDETHCDDRIGRAAGRIGPVGAGADGAAGTHAGLLRASGRAAVPGNAQPGHVGGGLERLGRKTPVAGGGQLPGFLALAPLPTVGADAAGIRRRRGRARGSAVGGGPRGR
jgi:Tfp pilus assembly protein PilF